MTTGMITTTSAAGKIYEYSKSRYENPDRVDSRRVEKKKGWQVAEMWDNHHEIARRLILGQKADEIAKDLGCTPQLISNVRNSPIVKDKMSIMRAARDIDSIDLSKEIMALAPIALEKIKEALTTGQVMGKEVSAVALLKEANSLLDREMGKAIQRVDTRNLNATLTLDDLERIKDKARSIMQT